MGASASLGYVKRIGNYDITADDDHHIGMGATGIVYPGVKRNTNIKVAAKKMTIEKEFLKEGEFEKESDLLLHTIPPHENIIKVYDFIKRDHEADGVAMLDIWLVMDFCELGNLRKYARQNNLSSLEKLDIMLQAARAVRHLHECEPQNIVHRDIKPENILLTVGHNGAVVKLCDFGASKVIERKGMRSVTLKSLAGTREYMAPEQLQPRKHGQFAYDRSVDVFSLGLNNLSLLECSEGKAMEVLTGKQIH